MQANLTISLAEYRSIKKYVPKTGDLIIWHGWFSHFYGIINGHDDKSVRVVKAGLPFLLFTMSQDQMDESHEIIPLSKIKGSKGGEYAVHSGGIWYV